ncbi:MAG: N-methylhydantoinase A [Gammaproteobacteria bacterium]|jgi:N-methylhydantoinase A
MYWVGVDVGGTFTDLVVYNSVDQSLSLGKSPSTPDDPGRGVLNALRSAAIDLSAVERFRHGATIATNTVLERRGARLGVLTTRGFRDVLIIGRGNRTKLYDIKAVRPPGLVKRAQVMEVDERLDANGDVLEELDESSARAAVQTLVDMQVEAVAVCFLHSYANPVHEQRVAAIVAEALPCIPVSRSSEVLPEHREFERFATTALNAYVAPRMSEYLSRLKRSLQQLGLGVAAEIMSSSGGSWPFEQMAQLPINSMLSGPAGGVIGAVAMAKTLAIDNVITYDMGGTSTDTCLVRERQYPLASGGSIGGLPNRAAQIEINTVGAGGGSLAYLDEGGFLNVGPRSAGAVPGPACYGRGGLEPTVTDANVVLGRFRPVTALGGEITIDVEAASVAVEALGQQLKLGLNETAEGIVRIAVARMTGAIKEISVMRGLDPRDFSLLAYGGAGPLHAALIAMELGIRTVIVPPLSGAFSAYGLLLADRRKDRSRTQLVNLQDSSFAELEALFEPMLDELRSELTAEGFAGEEMSFEQSVDLRFIGQAFELTTPWPAKMRDLDALLKDFHSIYERRYAHADDGPVELVALRVAAYGLTGKPVVAVNLPAARGGVPSAHSERPCCFDGQVLPTKIFIRDELAVGEQVNGPALIDEDGATTLVPPGFSASHDPCGALILRYQQADANQAPHAQVEISQ